MNLPHVTVILPSYNSAHFLSRTIISVLEQDFADFELLVLDNASTDATPDVVAGFADGRIRAVRHPSNLGMVGNINYGIRHARGQLAVILCADDHLAPDFLTRSLQEQARRPGLTFSNSLVCQNGQEQVFPNVFSGRRDLAPWRLARHLHGIPLSSLMFPLGAQREYFDERLPFNCDLEFVMRQIVQQRQPLTFMDWPGVVVNLHSANETRRYDIQKENIKLVDIVSRYTPFGLFRIILALQRMRLSHG